MKSTIPDAIEWFSDHPLPDFVPTPTVVLGGRRLLREFLRQSALINLPGTMSLAVASFSIEGIRSATEWTQFDHKRIDVRIITSDQESASNLRDALQVLPWRSFDASLCLGLHAKVYSYVAENGSCVCLIGSHNFSKSALMRNSEFGILLIGHGRTWATSVAQACSRCVRWLDDSQFQGITAFNT